MKKMLLLSIALSAVVLWAVGCGGSGGGTGNGPLAPSGVGTTAPPPPSATTVNIVSLSGSSAFNPNPVQVPSGGRIEWKNATSAAHVLVMNDGTPIATVGPNASVTTTLSGAGGNFRCTTHPSMVGSINGSAVPPPPSGDDDDY